MDQEADAAGSGSFTGRVDRGRGRTSNISANFTFAIPGLKEVQSDIRGMAASLSELKTALSSASQNTFAKMGFESLLGSIKKNADSATASVHDLAAAVRGVGSGGGGGGRGPAMPSGYGSGGGPGWASAASASAASAIGAAGGGGGTAYGTQATSSFGSAVGAGVKKVGDSLLSSIPVIGGMASGLMDIVGDFSLLPLRYIRERVQNNRINSLVAAQDLTPYAWMNKGSSISQLIGGLAGTGIQGDVGNILTSVNVGRQLGMPFGFGNPGYERSNNFYRNIAQMQVMTPGVGAGQLAQTLGTQVSNVHSQQAAAFYTGTAFSMVAQGGGLKSIQEWAEGILRWMEGQRPGSDRGKAFNYGELLAQNFPGSNFNAWFEMVGVTPQMRDYFWTYALSKANRTSGGTGGSPFNMTGSDSVMSNNMAWRKLRSESQIARNEFGLGRAMQGQYATREGVNEWWNKVMGQTFNKLIPAMTQKGQPLGVVQFIPDQMEDFLWNLMEGAGPIGAILGGAIGWGGALTGAGQSGLSKIIGGISKPALPGWLNPFGDPGDVGSPYDSYGGRTTAGLHPDLRSKVDAMMRANPRLTVNSGLRDSYTQSKLKARGKGHFGAVGMSPHSGGWAADLGPSSEYGWIMANAHKFGLHHAAKYGEPWHVEANQITPGRRPGGRGDPDVGDIMDTLIGAGTHLPGPFGSFFGGVDATKDAMKLIKKLLEAFVGENGIISEGLKLSSEGFLSFKELMGGQTGPEYLNKFAETWLNKFVGPFTAKKDAINALSPDYMSSYLLEDIQGLPTKFNVTGNLNMKVQDKMFSGGMLGLMTGGSGGNGGFPWLGGGTGTGQVSQADVASIYQKYNNNQRPGSVYSISASERSRVISALDAAFQAGFSGDELVLMGAIAGRESTWRPGAMNPNGRDKSYGLWQINMHPSLLPARANDFLRLGLLQDANAPFDELYDPYINAKAAKRLFDTQGPSAWAKAEAWGGRALGGRAAGYVEPVYAIAREQGYVGDPGEYYGGSSGGTTVHFHNKFDLSGVVTPSGNSGTSVDRMVKQIADKLEAEMNSRLARTR